MASLSSSQTARRAELLSSLVEIFLHEGFRSFGVGDLAKRLRCSRTTLYVIADSKEQIVLAVLRHLFRTATERIEAEVAAEPDPGRRIVTYLHAVADALRPASPAFYADLASFAAGREIYADNIGLASHRIQQLAIEGVEAGAMRSVNTAFVGSAVATVLSAIQRGEIEAATGISDADAYESLADLVMQGLVRRDVDEKSVSAQTGP